MKVSLVVPCYKSAQSLPALTARVVAEMRRLVAAEQVTDWELILVVDGSPDQTGAVAVELAESTPQVRSVHLRRNFGQHNALIAGIRAAQFEVTVTLDDDLQHPPEEIHKLLAKLIDAETDLVYANPIEEEHGAVRSWASQLVKDSLALAGVANARWVSAFRAFRTDLREGFTIVNDPQPNLDVLLAWSTTAVVPVQVRMDKRETGRSTYTLRQLIRHAMNMITGYGVAPLKLATWLGFSCGVIGIVLLLIVVVRYLAGETTVAGYTTIVAVVSLFSGAQMLTIGIIGEYLGRQHFRSMQKPTYLIAAEHGQRREAKADDIA